MKQEGLPFDDGRVSEAASTVSDAAAPSAKLQHHQRSHSNVAFFRHPRARRYVVRVRADGTVRVTIPKWGSKREAAVFAASQKLWIEKQLARISLEQDDSSESLPARAAGELRTRAVQELPRRLRQLAAEHGLVVSRISVRNQQWRWGSCSPKGHICLNWRLVQMPAAVRDYVMLHELMHLKRMDHSPRFWRLVEHVCPEYRDARAWLRANQRLLTKTIK